MSLSPSTLASSVGPKALMVTRSGVPTPWPPSAKNSTGKPLAFQSWPSEAARSVTFGFSWPGIDRPDRSPLMSAAKTGTPAAESCSVSSCSVLVLPVPVAPATRPCRLSMPSGIRMGTPPSVVASTINPPSSSAGPAKAYPEATAALIPSCGEAGVDSGASVMRASVDGVWVAAVVSTDRSLRSLLDHLPGGVYL